MASGVDQDQQWLIDCLNATLDTNQQVRSFAEASLNQASLQHGLLSPSLLALSTHYQNYACFSFCAHCLRLCGKLPKWQL